MGEISANDELSIENPINITRDAEKLYDCYLVTRVSPWKRVAVHIIGFGCRSDCVRRYLIPFRNKRVIDFIS